MAIEQGLTELPTAQVVGAFYYVLSKVSRERGFRIKDQGQDLFAPNTRNRSAIEINELNALMTDIKEKIARVVFDVRAGHFTPSPVDLKDCNDCNWSTVCRAKHLN